MTIDNAIWGSPFAPDFLTEPESIGELPEWDDLDAATLDKVESRLRAVLEAFLHQSTPNESQTEDDLIWKTSMVDERGRATGEAEGAGCGALSIIWTGPHACASKT